MLSIPGTIAPSDLDVRIDRYNRRIRFVGPERAADFDRWLSGSDGMLDGIGKIIVYARDDGDRGWERRGLVPEGWIRRYFVDGSDAMVWSCFIDEDRRRNPREAEEDQIVRLARRKANGKAVTDLPRGCESRIAKVPDASAVSGLLERTFRDYPDPVDVKTVEGWIRDGSRHFRIVERNGELVACASAEVDRTNRSAELTDCATLPEMRGKGLMTAILKRLEADCSSELGITDFYTLARAGEAGINIAFARLGYDFTARLVNNCRMPDGWESMNAWCRGA
jgi:beta-lysine N6-acetyltransferase